MRWINAVAGTALTIGKILMGIPAVAQAAPAPVPMPPTPPVQPRYVIVLDAAHGGSDAGARFESNLLEKDITLELAGRLRSVLQARSISVVTTREIDTTLLSRNRAETANHAQSAACIVIHATATGSGVHLFTSSLAPEPNQHFQPWQTAQAPWETQSMKLESEMNAALSHAQIPVTLGRASVQPMDNMTCPAVAVEVAPVAAGHLTAKRPVTDPAYQTAIVNALAAALVQWRSDWRQ